MPYASCACIPSGRCSRNDLPSGAEIVDLGPRGRVTGRMRVGVGLVTPITACNTREGTDKGGTPIKARSSHEERFILTSCRSNILSPLVETPQSYTTAA